MLSGKVLILYGSGKEFIYTFSIIDAAEIQRIGLVSVVSKETLMNDAMKFAKGIANGRASIRLAQQAINRPLILKWIMSWRFYQD